MATKIAGGLESIVSITTYVVLLCAALYSSPVSAECSHDTKSLVSVTTYCLNEFSSIATNNYTIDCSTGRTQTFMKCLASSGNWCVQRELPSIVSAAMTSYYRCGNESNSAHVQMSSPRLGRTCYYFCKIGWIHLRCGWECTNKTVIQNHYHADLHSRSHNSVTMGSVTPSSVPGTLKQRRHCSASKCICEIELPYVPNQGTTLHPRPLHLPLLLALTVLSGATCHL